MAESPDYARPDLLVEPAWLAAHLGDPDLRLIDADHPPAYGRAHIPGAVGHLDDNIYLKTGLHETFLMGPEQFAATMGKLGIGDDTLVVAYDGRLNCYAARLWWALNTYGHTNVKLLNGGWHRWLAEGRPVSATATRPPTASFTPRYTDHLLATCDQLRGAVGQPDTVILDVRSEAEYRGAEGRGNRRQGHVPGAVHLEWSRLVTDDERHVFRPAAELRELLAGQGITPDRTVLLH